MSLSLNLKLTFEKEITEQCIQVFELGMAEYNLREAEVNAFFSGQTQAIKDSQQRAKKILADFELLHKEVIGEKNRSLVFFLRFFHRFNGQNANLSPVR